MRLSRLKRAVFTLVAVTGSFMLLLVVLIAADLYAHHRVERSAGLNRHGYRGPVVGSKQPGEIRVVILGGSTVFGFDLEVEDGGRAARRARPGDGGRSPWRVATSGGPMRSGAGAKVGTDGAWAG